MTADSADATVTPSRYCTECGEYKSIRGVWYLVQPASEDGTRFYCETCFSSAGARPESPRRREGAPVVDPSRVPSGPGPTASEFDVNRRF